MKTDARIIHTRQALRSALLSLLHEKAVDSITVKEVCEKANVSRATFYKHYKDCYDLLRYMEKAMLETYLHALNITDAVDVDQLAAAVYDMVEKNVELFTLVYTSNCNEQRIQHLIDLAHDSTVRIWREKMQNISEVELEMLFSFVANGLVNTVASHFGKVEKEVLVKTLRDFMHRCMAPYL